jgi:hypothetical protein
LSKKTKIYSMDYEINSIYLDIKTLQFKSTIQKKHPDKLRLYLGEFSDIFLHNIKTIKDLPPEKQKEICKYIKTNLNDILNSN